MGVQRDMRDRSLSARKNGVLAEQVKLLVQTEQRLYRTRNELDRQLSRIRMLGDFALQSYGLESPAEIIGRAARVLLASFDLDEVTTALLDRGAEEVQVTRLSSTGKEVRRSEDVEVGRIDVACRVARPFLVTVDEDTEAARVEPWIGLISEGGLPPTSSDLLGQVVTCMPLRDAEDRLTGVVVACKRPEGRASYYKEIPGEEHTPFLQLLTSHLEHALQNSVLTSSLHERSSQLAKANEKLTASLETLERTQQQLLEVQKMEAIDRLAGGVAHDFNNLLTLILGHSHLLQTTLRADSKALEDVANIVNAGERAAGITSQLLAFSRKQMRTPVVVDLNALARNMGQMLGRLVGDHIRLELDPDPGVGSIRADRSQLEQTILNLVVNARDALPEGGVISIKTRPATGEDLRSEAADGSTGHVALIVEDDGQGMDAGTLGQIFEPFFTTKEVGHGTGMGLATVYGLVQQNEGSIHVTSEVGRGSCFTLVFPSSSEAPSLLGEERPERDDLQVRGTVLVVEDEEGVRALAARILRNGGFDVIAAADGQDAVERAAELDSPIDVLVTDVAMPRMDGIELANRLRLDKPDMQVVFMSGHALESINVPMGSERDSFIQKPFSPRVLVDHVRDALG